MMERGGGDEGGEEGGKFLREALTERHKRGGGGNLIVFSAPSFSMQTRFE